MCPWLAAHSCNMQFAVRGVSRSLDVMLDVPFFVQTQNKKGGATSIHRFLNYIDT